MRVIRVNRNDDQSKPQLQVGDAPIPVPQTREVLIRVVAAGVNRADVLQRDGHYPPPTGAPEWLGLEVSGVIESVGSSVTTVRPGQEVCAILAGGGYAEFVAVDERQVMPVPDGLDVVTAAAVPEVACTVWSNVVMTGRLQAGERFLVHGGSSGIGTMAIQVAKALGADVAATAGSADKLAFCRDLGADTVINYRDQDFVAEVRPGVDVILDSIGAKYLSRNVKALNPDGRLVIIGMLGGTRAEFDLAALLARRGTVAATSLRARSVDQKGEIVAATRRHVWPMIADGRVRIVVDSRYPLGEAAEAMAHMESSNHMGKILLTV